MSAQPSNARAESPSHPTVDDRTNLPSWPAPLTSLVGRERDIDRILALLDLAEIRLLTLTGPGGVGKTRLMLEVARLVAGDFADGVSVIPLASVVTPDLVLPALARSLGVQERGDEKVLCLVIDTLRRQHRAIVLDNFEHLLGEPPTWLTDLLGSCPRLKILVTSRSTLNLGGEHRYQVPPLHVPDGEVNALPDVVDTSAVRLFAQRARATHSDFTVDATNAEHIAEICRRLDGLPLAIELAAARIGVLSPDQILSRLTDRFGLLTGGQHDAPARLRSMRDAIAWSYDLLQPEDQHLFQRLSVFIGGFTLEAAEAISGTPDQPAADGLAGITALVDHSLIRRVDAGAGVPRYAMLETIREYAAERLAATGGQDAVRHRHATWCADLVMSTRTGLGEIEQMVAMDQLEVELANLLAALGWLDATGQNRALLALVNAMELYWDYGGREVEGLRWYERALSDPGNGTPSQRLDAFRAAGSLAHWVGHPSVDSWIEQTVALALGHGTDRQRGNCIYLAAVRAEDRGSYGQAETLFRESRSHFEAVGSIWDAICCDYHLGVVAYGQGDLLTAIARLEGARAEAEALGDPFVPGWCLMYLALVACERGDAAAATAHLRQHPPLDKIGHKHHLSGLWSAAGVVACELGDHDRAARFLGATAHDVIVPYPDKLAVERSCDIASRALGDERFAQAWEEGRRMKTPDVVTLFHQFVEGSATKSPVPATTTTQDTGLTSREVEVLRLLADGLTNAQIAGRLYISQRTAATHVRHIFDKLDVSSRAAAVAWAIRSGLA